MANDDEDTRTYRAVMNHEEQYSIWLADKELPLGWEDVGVVGSKQECLSHINEVWTDMRPLSLRKAMEENEAKAAAAKAEQQKLEADSDES